MKPTNELNYVPELSPATSTVIGGTVKGTPIDLKRDAQLIQILMKVTISGASGTGTSKVNDVINQFRLVQLNENDTVAETLAIFDKKSTIYAMLRAALAFRDQVPKKKLYVNEVISADGTFTFMGYLGTNMKPGRYRVEVDSAQATEYAGFTTKPTSISITLKTTPIYRGEQSDSFDVMAGTIKTTEQQDLGAVREVLILSWTELNTNFTLKVGDQAFSGVQIEQMEDMFNAMLEDLYSTSGAATEYSPGIVDPNGAATTLLYGIYLTFPAPKNVAIAFAAGATKVAFISSA